MVGEHGSEPRLIFGSISISCRADDETIVSIRHFILQGSSQWVIDQKVTEYGNICQIGSPMLVLKQNDDERTRLSLVKLDRLLYMPASRLGLHATANITNAFLLQTFRPAHGLISGTSLTAYSVMSADTSITVT